MDAGESDAFFLKADGPAFESKEAMRRFWNKTIRPHFPAINPYKGQGWAATARLIEWDFDYYRVAQQLGHPNLEQIRRDYDRDARLAKAMHGTDWLRRATRRPAKRNAAERRSEGSCIKGRPKMGLLLHSTGKNGTGPGGFEPPSSAPKADRISATLKTQGGPQAGMLQNGSRRRLNADTIGSVMKARMKNVAEMMK